MEKQVIIETQAKLASSLREFIDPMLAKRRIGMLYFQQLDDGGMIPRSVSGETDVNFLKSLIKKEKIFIPIRTTKVEQS